MGNIINDGMIDDLKVMKTCGDCHLEFEGWSETARCIKGLMPPQPYCTACQKERDKIL